MESFKQKINQVLNRGVDEIIEKQHFIKRIRAGEKLRIKFGIDPTSPYLHLGHSIPLLKLKEFQELGHHIIFLIGDFTARIGDPSGRTSSRAPLSQKDVRENMKKYKQQAAKILNMNKVEVRYNSEWWDKIRLGEFMKLAAKVTYSQVSQRADFKKRLAEDEDFTVEEFMYPILQGYDSVVLEADLEIGGIDQKFNMLMGRRIQKKYQQKPQDVMTLKLLVGVDGERKMSKTFGNFIGIAESPQTQYGKIMSIPDKLVDDYFELCTRGSLKEIKKLSRRNKKAELARKIVSIYSGGKTAEEAEKEFSRVFKEKKLPSKIPTIRVKEKELNILDLLVIVKMSSSRAEAKRLVEQAGVKINGKIEKDWKKVVEIESGEIIQAGKRRFIKIVQ
ncbi:MAG: tyrosine--tRNA ligase [Candidatus Nealsonbacteria bacterium]|nr:tyrosine--tRNA ligase [Candidatus Nealsonbacteria bacterium]